MDTLKIMKEIEDRLWAEHGDPIAKFTPLPSRIHETYYLSRLMEERGHKSVSPKMIKGEHEDRAYYSEWALQDAFNAGRLLTRLDNVKARKEIREELKHELMQSLEEL